MAAATTREKNFRTPVRIGYVQTLLSLMALTQEEVVSVLFAARSRISTGIWLVVRDSQVAEDIFQTTAVKAIAPGASFASQAHLLSWVQVVARREALDWLRRSRPECTVLEADVLTLLEQQAQADPTPEGARVDALRDCVELVPQRSRRLLELRYCEGRSCEEVAKATGVKLAAVYQRLSRLHRALKGCVERRLAGGAAMLSANLEAS